MNEEDITFNYDSDKDTLRAIASKPLIIHNNSLGYHFIYHLEIVYYGQYSNLRLLEKAAFIDRDGFFDPDAIDWGGRMSVQRIADFLPYEYSIDPRGAH